MSNSESIKSVLADEIDLYEKLKSQLEEEHRLEWVVIHGQDVVGFYGDFQEAAGAAVGQFGRGPYLIKEVGAPEVSIPLSFSTRPMHA